MGDGCWIFTMLSAPDLGEGPRIRLVGSSNFSISPAVASVMSNPFSFAVRLLCHRVSAF